MLIRTRERWATIVRVTQYIKYDSLIMIRGFRDKKTESLFSGEMVKEFTGFRNAAERKLTMLDNASDHEDLLSSAGNRLEKLREDWAGQVN